MFVLVGCISATAAGTYTIVDLGALPGRNRSMTRALNSRSYRRRSGLRQTARQVLSSGADNFNLSEYYPVATSVKQLV